MFSAFAFVSQSLFGALLTNGHGLSSPLFMECKAHRETEFNPFYFVL